MQVQTEILQNLQTKVQQQLKILAQAGRVRQKGSKQYTKGCFPLYVLQTKVRWRFCKILWPSQNIRTLLRVKAITISLETQRLTSIVLILILSSYTFSEIEIACYVLTKDKCHFFASSNKINEEQSEKEILVISMQDCVKLVFAFFFSLFS